MGAATEELNLYLQEDVDTIIESTTEITGITIEQIMGKSRKRHFVDARKILVNVMRKHLKLTCFQVAKVINKDHSSIVHYEKMHPIHLKEEEYRRLYSAVSGTFLIRKSVRDEERLQDQFRNLQHRTKALLHSLQGQGEKLSNGIEEVKETAI